MRSFSHATHQTPQIQDRQARPRDAARLPRRDLTCETSILLPPHSSSTMLLRHLHLPNLTSYTHAAKLQDRLVSALLSHKANPTSTSAPPPTVITAQFQPVYTCGRREVNTVTPEQKDYLTTETPWGRAEFHTALRGGQTTFHGPGQLVAYPILDLRRHDITPRCWVHLLESTVISTCTHYGVKTMRTENPGVWVDEMKKICALGVHLRRNVTSHGVGLNVGTELGWFGRIVACGLEGKGTTSLANEGVMPVPTVDEVAAVFVKTLSDGLDGVDGVEVIREAEIG
jgi:lipoyl(octanoyl) transferase 2